MSLSLRKKQSFYQSLGQLIRSGITFPAALEKLLSTARGPLRTLITRLGAAVASGCTVGEAFGQQPAVISLVESSIIEATERSGCLEHGFQQLAVYSDALAKAREMVIRKSAYPLFMLHFGVLALALPLLVNTDLKAYLRATMPLLGALYVASIAMALLITLFRNAGATNPLLDRILRVIPWTGNVRRSFAVSRFCMVYEIELNAGVNIIVAVLAAARASGSGLIQCAVRAAVPQVREGSQVGPLLAQSGAFPEAVTRAIVVGEASGELDSELKRLAAESQEEALAGLESAAARFSKLIYLSVLIYMGWRIVDAYRIYLNQVNDLMKDL